MKQTTDWRHPVLFFAFGFGSGLARKAPGTWGSLAALPCFVALSFLPPLFYWAFIVAATLFGFWVCGAAARLMNVHDHESIVWDEFVGQWLALTVLLPVSVWNGQTLLWMLLGFGLFRFFDILKPWPISWVDRHVHGGFGIMLDDLLAGVFAGIVLAVIYHMAGGSA